MMLRRTTRSLPASRRKRCLPVVVSSRARTSSIASRVTIPTATRRLRCRITRPSAFRAIRARHVLAMPRARRKRRACPNRLSRLGALSIRQTVASLAICRQSTRLSRTRHSRITSFGCIAIDARGSGQLGTDRFELISRYRRCLLHSKSHRRGLVPDSWRLWGGRDEHIAASLPFDVPHPTGNPDRHGRSHRCLRLP